MLNLNPDAKLRDIDFFEFPDGMVDARIENCLGAVGIETVGDLINPKKELYLIRNLGMRSLRAISKQCKEFGIPLQPPYNELENIKSIDQLKRIQLKIRGQDH